MKRFSQCVRIACTTEALNQFAVDVVPATDAGKMCGRYTIKNTKGIERWHIEWLEVEWLRFVESYQLKENYNVSPTHTMPVVRANDAGKAEPAMMRWGLVPFWEKSEKPKMAPINARSEEVLGKPMFKQSVQKRRCLIPADGFYEWRRVSDDVKFPFHIQRKGGAPFFIAGIYERATENRPDTYALLTTGPNELMRPIHDRMPVILSDAAARAWVTPGEMTPEAMNAFNVPFPAEQMEAYEVSRLVNSPKNNTRECCATLPELNGDGEFSLS